MNNQPSVIICGVNGQLGQFLAKYLLELGGLEIIGTVRHKSYDQQPFIFDKERIKFELLDLTDSSSIENIIQKYKPTYFINTAANAFVGESWDVPIQHFQINAMGVLYQLQSIAKFSPETRYFNMGTSEEFGDVKYTPQDEKHILSPRSPYGSSKCAARFIVKVYRESFRLYALQGWTFNFESEIRGEKYVTRKITKNVARIHDAFINNKPFEPLELGEIDNERSWQYAEDVADGIWRMLNQEKYRKDLISKSYSRQQLSSLIKEYILSSDTTHSIRNFCELAFQEAGLYGFWQNKSNDKKDEVFLSKVTKKELIKINPKFFRLADVYKLHGDSSLARKELNWCPKVGFEELVNKMVNWDIKNYSKEV